MAIQPKLTMAIQMGHPPWPINSQYFMEETISLNQFQWFLKFKSVPIIYFLYNGSNEIIYIGKSTNFPARLSDHAKRTWFEEIAHIKLIAVEGEEESISKKELDLIKTHQPKYNRMGVADLGDEEEILSFLRRNPFVNEHKLATGIKLAAWKRKMILDSLSNRGIVSRGAPARKQARWHILPV